MAHIWLIKFDEQLEFDGDPFLGRMSNLGFALRARGHIVSYFSGEIQHRTGLPRQVVRSFWRVVVGESGIEYVLLAPLLKNSRSSGARRLINAYWMSWLVVIKLLFMKTKPDLVVCASPFPHTGFILSCVGKIFRVRVVLDVRDLWPDIFADEGLSLPRFLQTLLVWSMRAENRVAGKLSSAITSINKEFLNLFLKKNLLANLDIVSESFYICTSRVIKEHLGAPLLAQHNVVKIGFAGTISKTTFNGLKNFHDMVQAAGLDIDINVEIYGGGRFLEMARNHLTSFHFTGPLPFSEIEARFAQQHFALNFVELREDYQNSLSNKFFDYLALGKPIICQAGSVMAGVVEDQGIGIVIKDHTGLVELRQSLYDNHDRYSSFLINIHNLNCNEFNRDITYSNYSRFLEKIIDS